MAYLPSFLTDSSIFKQVYEANMSGVSTLHDKIQDLLNQCFVDTATWGLKYWEEFVGLPVDEAKDIQWRRDAIKGRLRISGTVTKENIRNVASSFSECGVAVIEYGQAAGGDITEADIPTTPFTFNIKFTDRKGYPPNLKDMQAAIEALKPAHLMVAYIYLFTYWTEVKLKTWDEVKVDTWLALRTR